MALFPTDLRNSRYLEPAQQMLDEVVRVSNAVDPSLDEQIKSIRSVGRRPQSSGRSLQLWYGVKQHEGNTHHSSEKHDVQIKIDKLEALLHELERRCDRYFNELDRVVSSFEVVAGRGAASPYTLLTIQAMSKYFSNLRDAIITQIHSSAETLSKDLPRDRSLRTMERTLVHCDAPISLNWTTGKGGTTEQLIGGTTVGLLRAWLFEHMLHPYPDANEKLMLASKTGLTRTQISHWFINARCRLWKPMIEQLYREEFEDDSNESNTGS